MGIVFNWLVKIIKDFRKRNKILILSSKKSALYKKWEYTYRFNFILKILKNHAKLEILWLKVVKNTNFIVLPFPFYACTACPSKTPWRHIGTQFPCFRLDKPWQNFPFRFFLSPYTNNGSSWYWVFSWETAKQAENQLFPWNKAR